MWVSHDLYGLLIVAGSLLTFLGLAEWLRKQGAAPEVTRKFVHISGGVVCLLLPFLIQSVWVVFGFALSVFLIFYIACQNKYFKSIHGVSRESLGTVYYPLAIFLIFFLSKNQPWLYVTSISVLALCDAAASLVGGKYGQHYYFVEDEQKSVEGSLIFLLLAYLVIQVPSLLMTDLDSTVVVLASLLVAILVTGVEAISLKGTDNIFIPVSVCLFLAKITTKPVDVILYQNISLLAICALTCFAVWRMPAFNIGATILLVLFSYGTWSLGSEMWALPILMMSVAYFILWGFYHHNHQFKFAKVRRTTKALAIPFCILFLANYTDKYDFFYAPFLAANTVLFMAIFHNFVRYDQRALQFNLVLRAFSIATLTWLIIVVPPWIFGAPVELKSLVSIWVIVVVMSMINIRLPVLSDAELDRLNVKNAVMPLAAAVAIMLIQIL